MQKRKNYIHIIYMQEDIIEVSKHNLTKYIFVILIWDACMYDIEIVVVLKSNHVSNGHWHKNHPSVKTV